MEIISTSCLEQTGYLDAVDDGPKEQFYNSKACREHSGYLLKMLFRRMYVASSSPHPVQSVWKLIVDLPVLHPTVVMCENSIISVGGIKNGAPHEAIYRFVIDCFDSPYWTKVGHMSVGKHHPAVVYPLEICVLHCLFLVGLYGNGKKRLL